MSPKSIFLSGFYLIVHSYCYGQENPDLTMLKIKREQASNVIQILQDSVKKIDQQIDELFISQLNNSSRVKATIQSNAIAYEAVDRKKKVGEFKKDEIVSLLDYDVYQFYVTNGVLTGYVSYVSLIETDDVKLFVQVTETQERERREKELEEELQKEIQKREKEEHDAITRDKKEKELRETRIKKTFAKYGNSIISKIINNEYWIGMTEEMTIYSLGSPKNINTNVGSWGRHEQWVYYRLTLYFENGILKSFQENQ